MGAPPPGGTPGPPRGNRGAPPRGVGVKETPAEARKGQKGPISGKYRQKGVFWRKSLKMPIFGIFRDFLPGSYRAKTGPGTPFWAKSSKWG